MKNSTLKMFVIVILLILAYLFMPGTTYGQDMVSNVSYGQQEGGIAERG